MTTPAPLPTGYTIEQIHGDGPLYWRLVGPPPTPGPAVEIAHTRTESMARLLAFTLQRVATESGMTLDEWRKAVGK